MDKTTGVLLVISGPSGTGKSTLVKELLHQGEFPLAFSVSATTRPPRVGEVAGVHYHFLSRPEFETLRQQGQFLECAEVHGNGYGTLHQPVQQNLAAGKWVVLDIDVEGFRQVKAKCPEAVGVFVRAASDGDYRQRLEQRGTDSPAVIQRRLERAARELAFAHEYDFQVVNETISQATRTLRTLLWGVQALRGKPHAG